MMKRKVMTLEQIIDMVTDGCGAEPHEAGLGINYWVEVENMGWCRDGCTRWYTFTDYDDVPCIYFRHGDRPKYN